MSIPELESHSHQRRHPIEIVLGDITLQSTDAIVNAANNRMRGGGGVDGAIHHAGGPAILKDCIVQFPNGLATGDAGFTGAGNLPNKWVIHAVGPNWNAGQRDPILLVSAYRRSLEVAEELGAESISFPLISAGVYGWPIEDAVRIAIETLSFAPESMTVRLVTFNPALYDLASHIADEVSRTDT